MILALDPATKCGWAALRDDDRIDSGVWDLSPDKGQPSGARLSFLRTSLAVTHKDHPIEAIAVEVTPSMRGGPAVKVAHQLHGVIEMFAFDKGIPLYEVHASTLKKHITGSGRADKKAVKARVWERLIGATTAMTDDESDALAVLLWAMDTHQARRAG